MSSTINSKEIQFVSQVGDTLVQLCSYNYYKFRPGNMTFAFNSNNMKKIFCFAQFNSLRKNFLLSKFDHNFESLIKKCETLDKYTKYKDYYFMP